MNPRLIAAFIGTLLLGAGFGYGAFKIGSAHSPANGDAMSNSLASTLTSQAASHPQAGKPIYTCPMHSQVVADHPAQCPICGMDLVLKQAASHPQAGKPIYTCPMHPQVVADHPAQCPVCGMDLVLKQAAAPVAHARADGAASSPELEPGVETVSLSPRQRVLANIETTKVARGALTRTLETTGRITTDESRLTSLSAWVDGRIDYLAVRTTGAPVMKGSVVARIYSPELVATQQEYLTAWRSARELGGSPYPELVENARALVAAARQRLTLLGITGGQIRQIEASGKPIVSFPILASGSGIVTERKVQQGQYVKAGDVLFSLADYSRVWVEASVYEADLTTVKAGTRAEVRLAALPGKVFAGRVAFIQPVLSAETRTGQLRIELVNPLGELKPEMYANVRILTPQGAKDQLVVPASAVIATGRHHLVYVEVATNQFQPRTVMVGPKAGDRYPIFAGLEAGEQVATSGTFLLDASAEIGGAKPHAGHEAP